MRTMKSALLSLPMRLVLLAGMAALFTSAATTVSAALLYNPVVVVAEGPAGTDSGQFGAKTSIFIYKESLANQLAPISSTSYVSTSTNTDGTMGLVTGQSDLQEGYLANNPGVANAAAKGKLYGGTQYVYNAGYDNVHGTLNVKSTQATSATGVNSPRSFGQTNVTGSVASNAVVLQTQLVAVNDPQTGALTPRRSPYDNASIRGAVGDDTGGSTTTGRYTAGTTTTTTPTSIATGGFRNFGANTLLTTPVNTTNALHNVRTIELLGGNLFGTSSNASTKRGIYLLNPAGAAVSATDQPRYIDTGATSNPHEFALFDDPNLNGTGVTLNLGYDTAYIADERTDANGGIQKWTWNGTVWSLAYTLKDLVLPIQYRGGLAGQLDPVTNLITLYASGQDTLTTQLKQVTDTGALSLFTTLATLPKAGGSFFHGVALAEVPEPSALLLGVVACGAIGCAARRRRFVA